MIKKFYQSGLSSLLLVLMLSLLLELVLFSVLMVSRLGFQRSVRFDRSRQAFVAAEGIMQDTLYILRKQEGWPDKLAKNQTFQLGDVKVDRRIVADSSNENFQIEIQTDVNQALRKLTAEYQITKTTHTTEPGAENLPIDVVLILDVSDSMADSLQGMKNAVVELLQSSTFEAQDRIGIVVFAERASVLASLTADKNTLVQKVKALSTNPMTNTADGLLKGALELDQHARSDAQKMLILFTDGVPTRAVNSTGGLVYCTRDTCAVPGSKYAPGGEGSSCTQTAITIADNIRKKYEVYGIFYRRTSGGTCNDFERSTRLGRTTVQSIAGPDQTKYFEMSDILHLTQIFREIEGEIIERKGGVFKYQEVVPE